MSIAELDTLYAAAVAAIDDGDYATAITKLMAMQARLSTTPNLTRGTGGGGSQSIAWNASEIPGLITNCRKQLAAATAASGGPFQQSKVVYARADNSGDYS